MNAPFLIGDFEFTGAPLDVGLWAGFYGEIFLVIKSEVADFYKVYEAYGAAVSGFLFF